MKIEQIKRLYSRKDKEHNFLHILRLKKKVKILKKPYKVNEELLNFLVLFHGLKDYVKKHKSKFNKEQYNSLLRHNSNPRKIEEKIVFDANMLDNVGKNGLKKALRFGKMINRSKKDTIIYIKKNINKAKFYTKLGKKLGRKELKNMRKYL